MAVNVFLKFSDPAIRGESIDSAHAGEIQVLSWSHSFNQPTRPRCEKGAEEQANHSDFTFSKYLDSATDELLRHCWNGQVIGRAVLTCYRSDSEDAAIPYMRIEMEDVVISNVSIGGGPGDLPTESVSLAYGKVTYTYAERDSERSVSHGLIGQVVR